MREDFLVFGKPVIEEPEIAEVVASLRSGWIGTGPKVQRFERMLEEYTAVPHVRCLSSCTAALILGMRAMGVGPGDEVILPSMTFVASANAVVHAGATPVLVDSEPGTGLIDLDAAEAAITPRTKALMPVHFAGRPVDMDRVNAIRDKHGLLVIEDAAHAIGTAWRGTKIGGHGNLTAYSFYVTKNITTGEGGALATEDPNVAAEVERLALHGLSLGAWQRFSDSGFKHYEVDEPGFKFNMMDIQAALGIHQLPRLDAWIDQRSDVWERYDELLAGLPVETPAPPEGDMRHARHLYQVLVTQDAGVSRDEVLGRMTAHGVGTGVHYRGVHLHPYYRDRYRIDAAELPVATDISDRTLSLPLSPALTHAEQTRVVDALTAALRSDRRVDVQARS
jgi:dTDP-4-amino-4,6-dideoxygalactose transaminase